MATERKGLQRIRPMLDIFIEKLKSIYGDSLKSVVLFGSYARGEEREESDIDLLLLLDMTKEEINRCDDALCDLIFDYEVTEHLEISPITMSIADYSKWKGVHEFLRNVREDGVSLYGATA